jgi:hypothetical protein
MRHHICFIILTSLSSLINYHIIISLSISSFIVLHHCCESKCIDDHLLSFIIVYYRSYVRIQKQLKAKYPPTTLSSIVARSSSNVDVPVLENDPSSSSISKALLNAVTSLNASVSSLSSTLIHRFTSLEETISRSSAAAVINNPLSSATALSAYIPDHDEDDEDDDDDDDEEEDNTSSLVRTASDETTEKFLKEITKKSPNKEKKGILFIIRRSCTSSSVIDHASSIVFFACKYIIIDGYAFIFVILSSSACTFCSVHI